MQISLIIAILLLLSSVASGRVSLNWREAKLRALSILRLQCGDPPPVGEGPVSFVINGTAARNKPP